MNYIQGIDRDQSTAFPEVFDDLIGKENPVRFLDAFVDHLNVRELGFTHAALASTGRPPFHPKHLLKLYIYGYLKGTRTSRKLEDLTTCNIEVMWLINRVHPDHKVIADFRKDHVDALKNVTKTFTLFCKEMNLFGRELIGIDGSKFDAVNHSSKQYTKKKVEERLAEINTYIAAFYAELDNGDTQEEPEGAESDCSLEEKIAAMIREKDTFEGLQKQMEESGETQIALTDPDSRLMTASTGRRDMSYNVQIAVDDKHSLIVAYDVINDGNDLNALSSIAIQAKEILGSEQLHCITDMGYFERDEIKKCHDANIICSMPRPKKSHNRKLGLYTYEDFTYDAEQNCYRCPAGKILTYRGDRTKNNKIEKTYASNACRSCLQRSQCTRSKRDGRRIYRWEHEDLFEEMEERLRKNPQLMRKRSGLVEHPFGTMKCTMNQRAFLMKGKHKVSGEMGLTVLAYNIKRVLNILGVARLIDIFKEKGSTLPTTPSFSDDSSLGAHILRDMRLPNVQDHSKTKIWSLSWWMESPCYRAYACAA
jgi:transposase